MKLAFGLMRLPVIDGDTTKIDIELFKKMADKFISEGGTYFDTAWPYHGGMSELAFKEAVSSRYDRDKYTLTDKLPLYEIKQEEDLERIFNQQLEKTGVGYFDYYWLHAIGEVRYDEVVQKFKCFEFIQKKKAEGKIKHIGFSFHDKVEVLERILNDHPEVEYVQLQLNYLDWKDDEKVQSRLCYETCVKHNKPVMVMEPIRGGALANLHADAEKLMKDYNPNASIASWAVRFCASLDNVERVLSGMSNYEQMEDNLSYMKDFKPLSDEERQIIDKALDITLKNAPISCTGCRYCVSENTCPMNICIPDYFATYNNYKLFKKDAFGSKQDYKKLCEENGKPSDCIECGGCEVHCPQHLAIRDYLKLVAKQFD